MSAAPLFQMMNFPIADTAGDLINAATSVYNTGTQARNAAAQRKYFEQQAEWYPKIQASQIALQNAQIRASQLEAEKAALMINAMKNFYPGGGMGDMGGQGTPNPSAQNIPLPESLGEIPGLPQFGGISNVPRGTLSEALNQSSQINPLTGQAQYNPMMGAGAIPEAPSLPNIMPTQPRGQQGPMSASAMGQLQNLIGPYPGPSQQTVAFRAAMGFPTVFPEEQAAIDNWKKTRELYTNEMLKLQFPTGETQTRHQRITEIGDNWAHSLKQLADSYESGPIAARLPKSSFDKLKKTALESTAIIKNYPGAAGLEVGLGILSPGLNESTAEFRQRLYQMAVEATPVLEKAYREQGKQLPQKFYQDVEDLKPKEVTNYKVPSGGYKASDPAVIQTAKNRGISPEQAAQMLNEKLGVGNGA